MSKTQTMTNGLNVTQLQDTISAIRQSPCLGNFVFRADNEWIDGALNRTTIGSFYGAGQEDTSRQQPFVFDNDEPPVLLGENRGGNPVEFVLHALAGCLTTSLVLHAAARGIVLHEVESRLEGNIDMRGLLAIDDSVRNGYEAIRVTFRIKGEATPEQLEELCRLAQARSPVFDVVSHGVPVTVSLDR